MSITKFIDVDIKHDTPITKEILAKWESVLKVNYFGQECVKDIRIISWSPFID